jgi:protein-S-isoprenylcysteine O-methyltransferase Ste14
MARDGFKKWIARVIPTAAERATYVLMSGVVTMLAIYFWQPLPGTVWSVENSVAQIVLWSAYAIGWGYLFIATFVTNHFELMGLRQVYLFYVQREYTQLPFTRKLMYRYSRHPMMLGLLIGMWALPVMSLSHFVMSLFFTLYMIVGVYLEEKGLVARFGDTYHKYKEEIATIIPRLY